VPGLFSTGLKWPKLEGQKEKKGFGLVALNVEVAIGQFDLLKEIKFGQIKSVYMYVIFSDFRLILIGSG
jgi:hypothetical protein